LDGSDSELTHSAREATHALLVYINSRNPNQSLLALNVLDRLVKVGGYPIHLQISTKEFLNELVRRFPERPPMVIGRVMGRILEVRWEPAAEPESSCQSARVAPRRGPRSGQRLLWQ